MAPNMGLTDSKIYISIKTQIVIADSCYLLYPLFLFHELTTLCIHHSKVSRFQHVNLTHKPEVIK